jgi:hypothetical protein
MESEMMRTPEPTYAELLRMGWAMFWRGVGSFIVLLFSMNVLILFLMPELTRTEPSFWVAVLPLAMVTVLCTFVTMPSLASWSGHRFADFMCSSCAMNRRTKPWGDLCA